ncbi:MAG TPA: efflux RND transporter periplasmic adaptor subunit [Gemmatimonadaceae bacterium]
MILSRARVAVLASCALAACSREPSSRVSADTTAAVASDSAGHAVDVTLTPEQQAKVRVAAVSLAPFRTSLQTTGTVAFNGDRSTQVLAPVSGPITKILVNPGAYVRQGAPLATVTSPDFAAAIATYRKAQSAYRNAQRIADLDAQLFKNDALARREAEQAATDAAAAAADRDAAIEQMRALGVDDASIAAMKEGGAAPSATAVIRAPIEGTVVEKLVTPGQLIQAGTTPAFTIADLSSVWVQANVFETDIGLVTNGEKATITTGASPTPIEGTVTYVGSLVDPSSKATAVRILAPNPRGILKRDMLVNVSIRSAMSRNTLLLPLGAVLRDDQNLPFVFVSLPNGHYARRQIKLGSRTGDSLEVVSGITSGERIVMDGALFLQFAGSQ